MFTCIIPPHSGIVSTPHHLSDHHNTRSTSIHLSTLLSKQRRDQPHTQTTLLYNTTSMIRYHQHTHTAHLGKTLHIFVTTFFFVLSTHETYPYSYEFFLFTQLFLPVQAGGESGGSGNPPIYIIPSLALGAFRSGSALLCP